MTQTMKQIWSKLREMIAIVTMMLILADSDYNNSVCDKKYLTKNIIWYGSNNDNYDYLIVLKIMKQMIAITLMTVIVTMEKFLCSGRW